MYKPANIREFVTPAIQKRTTTQTVNGRQQKVVETVATLRGKVRAPRSADIIANGLTIVHSRMEFITWWKDDLKAGDILTINGKDYFVDGQPENVEMRGRYAVIPLRLLEGGA